MAKRKTWLQTCDMTARNLLELLDDGLTKLPNGLHLVLPDPSTFIDLGIAEGGEAVEGIIRACRAYAREVEEQDERMGQEAGGSDER